MTIKRKDDMPGYVYVYWDKNIKSYLNALALVKDLWKQEGCFDSVNRVFIVKEELINI